MADKKERYAVVSIREADQSLGLMLDSEMEELMVDPRATPRMPIAVKSYTACQQVCKSITRGHNSMQMLLT